MFTGNNTVNNDMHTHTQPVGRIPRRCVHSVLVGALFTVHTARQIVTETDEWMASDEAL